VQALGLAGEVLFPGTVRDGPDWILAADVVVLSSASEGTPIALLEAMALGRPVVSTAVGGVPDVVEDGVTGLLVPVEQGPAGIGRALARLAGDPALRGRLGAAGAATVPGRFSAERLVAGTAGLYERILGRTQPCGTPDAR
jgi:glycosyltransferase involved in cell wall biosynthesis